VPEKRLLVVGHVGEYSGVVGSSLSSGLATIGAWTRWVNDNGGINGQALKVITADSGSDPAKAFSLVKAMVERDRVIAFVGNITPISGTGYADYLAGKRIPVVGGDITLDSQWYGNPMFFPQGASLETQATAVLNIAARAQKGRVASLYCQEASVCQQADGYMRKPANQQRAGGQVVYSAQISLAQPDYTAECLQAQRSGAQAVYIAADANTQSRIARSCWQQGYKPLYLAVSIAVTDAAKDDPHLDGFSAPQSVFPWPATDTAAVRRFREAVNRYAPRALLGGTGALVWSSGMLFLAATRNIPSHSTSRNILDGLYAIKNNTLDGLTPPLTFTEGAKPEIPSCYAVASVQRGTWVAPDGSTFHCLPPASR
jgi:branched-chain amino acid transport system substrate-binding protein